MERLRIVLAEDNPEMRETIKRLVEVYFDVVATVADGEQAINSVLKLRPDILLTDMSMPIVSGIQVASRIRELGTSTKVIFVTVHDDDNYQEAAFSIGALGYVLKARIDIDLVPTVHAALQGRRFSSHIQTRAS